MVTHSESRVNRKNGPRNPHPAAQRTVLGLLQQQRQQVPRFRRARVFLRNSVQAVELEGWARVDAGGWLEFSPAPAAPPLPADVTHRSYPPTAIAHVDWLADDLTEFPDPFEGLGLLSEEAA